MLGLADSLDSLLRGARLVSLSLAFGSIPWGLRVLRGLPSLIAELTRDRPLPGLRTPSVETMRTERVGTVERGERTHEAYLWSNFSHDVCGLILVAMLIIAFILVFYREANVVLSAD